MDPHQQKIIEAARRLGIAVEELAGNWHMDVVRLSWQGTSTFVSEGRIFTHLSALADQVVANKMAAKALMTELGIPVPAGMVLRRDQLDKAALTAWLDEHEPAVLKPLFGSDGFAIVMHVRLTEQVLLHLQAFPTAGEVWLLEEQAQGEDLRLQYLGGTLIAACIRKPCTLRGDGQHSVGQLIDLRNALIHTQNPDNHIEVDHQVRRRVAHAGLGLDDILPKGQELQIKDVSNMAQGGHALDVTERVHPRYQTYMDRLARALDLRLFSLDVMTPAPEADPDQAARVLEINAQPAWLHHTFSEGRQHDIPALILRDFFQMP